MTREEVVAKVRQQAHEYVQMNIAVSEEMVAAANSAENSERVICELASHCLSDAADSACRDAGIPNHS